MISYFAIFHWQKQPVGVTENVPVFSATYKINIKISVVVIADWQTYCIYELSVLLCAFVAFPQMCAISDTVFISSNSTSLR